MKTLTFWMLLCLCLGPTTGCGGSTVDEHDDHEEAGDSHEEDEHVTLTPAQVEAAGIRTETAGTGRIESLLELSAAVDVDLDAQAHVNPRIRGLVRRVHVALGQSVSLGDPLCTIDSVELGRAVGEYLADHSTLAATLDVLERERALLQSNLELARQVFERERDLAEREITTLTARYEAERALQEAELRHDSRLLELEARLARERIELAAAERELEILGLSHDEVVALPTVADTAHEPLGTYIIRAPRDGVIVARDVTESEYVDADMRLFLIQDLGTVWVQAAVYEQDLSRIAIGAPAHVHLDAFPGSSFEGVVDFINYRIDAATRSTTLRIELPNEPVDDWPEALPLRPGMYGRVGIVTGVAEAAISVPESALVHEADGEHVFVAVEPGVFEPREVRLGVTSHDRVEVLDGLAPGDQVVVAGTFALKSAARAGELGGGHDH